MCGENTSAQAPVTSPPGSSPRVRGKRSGNPDGDRRARLIPACAGKTFISNVSQGFPWAHPRVCGENKGFGVQVPSFEGSSPRVRGKRQLVVYPFLYSRLIPACAGKTPRSSRLIGVIWAHPRVCGENVCPSWFLWPWLGSSPRVRGKHLLENTVHSLCGLIPACAGKTKRSHVAVKQQRAHPRVCGENSLLAAIAAARSGSSPRVRGKLKRDFEGQKPTRLIPACAGKTRAKRALVC